jgi:hypothetical protein
VEVGLDLVVEDVSILLDCLSVLVVPTIGDPLEEKDGKM